ncbi:MAG: hypothetical protein EOP41_01470 [Sphingobacteriaceae bacterium]|nr:MAG: hypothetical protein EOP41_01470 [Sphingobacteriaceae bacterium]
MLLLPDKNSTTDQQKILLLEQEIALLEAELLVIENAVNAFRAQLQAALSVQIRRIQELTSIYKDQKQAKKQKRLEQKKRGKNYQKPLGLKLNNASFTGVNLVSAEKKQELKRLYKEAVVQIHPDKLVDADDELNRCATDITAQLNAYYKSGNLDELNRLHEHIISGNALSYKPDQPETITDLPAMMLFLQEKKRKLEVLLQEIKSSEIYNLWLSRKDVSVLIEELKLQFSGRILIMEKRIK